MTTTAQVTAKTRRAERLRDARTRGTHTKSEWNRLLDIVWYQVCPRCRRFCDDRLVKDHVRPLFIGGSDGIDNIQPLCQRCNQTKGKESTNWLAHWIGMNVIEGTFKLIDETRDRDWRVDTNWSGDTMPYSTGGGI